MAGIVIRRSLAGGAAFLALGAALLSIPDTPLGAILAGLAALIALISALLPGPASVEPVHLEPLPETPPFSPPPEAPAPLPPAPLDPALLEATEEAQALLPFTDAVLAKVPQLTEEATFQLIERFEAVRAVSSKAAGTAARVLESARAREGADAGFTDGARAAIKAEGERIQEMAAQNRRTVSKLRQIAEEIGAGMETLKGIEEITDRSTLIAFNMAIEAARIGDKGRGIRVIVGELRSLNERTGDFSRQVGEMLARFRTFTGDLVQEVATQSESVIQGVEAGMRATDETVESLIVASRTAEATSREIAGQAEEINQALDGVLESLQFQDVTRQMIDRSRALLGELGASIAKAARVLTNLSEERGRPDPARFELLRKRLAGSAVTRPERDAILEVHQ